MRRLKSPRQLRRLRSKTPSMGADPAYEISDATVSLETIAAPTVEESRSRRLRSKTPSWAEAPQRNFSHDGEANQRKSRRLRNAIIQ